MRRLTSTYRQKFSQVSSRIERCNNSTTFLPVQTHRCRLLHFLCYESQLLHYVSLDPISEMFNLISLLYRITDNLLQL